MGGQAAIHLRSHMQNPPSKTRRKKVSSKDIISENLKLQRPLQSGDSYSRNTKKKQEQKQRPNSGNAFVATGTNLITHYFTPEKETENIKGIGSQGTKGKWKVEGEGEGSKLTHKIIKGIRNYENVGEGQADHRPHSGTPSNANMYSSPIDLDNGG